MSASITLEEKFKALIKNYEYLQAQNKEMASQNVYLRRQLGESLKQKRREIRSSSSLRSPGSVWGEGEAEGPQTGGPSSEEGSLRHPRRGRRP